MGTTNAARSETPSTVTKGAPSPAEIQEIAAEAVANVRTVERRLLGLPVRGHVAARVDAALARRGFQGR